MRMALLTLIRRLYRCRMHACALALLASSWAGAGEGRPLPRGPSRVERPRELLNPRATVLVVGDSLVGGPIAFARVLRERLQTERVRVVQDTWVGVGIQRFAYSKRFRELLARHHPTHVIVVLGTNDYAVPSPSRVVPAIERVVKYASAVPCAWVGPLLRHDTGIVQTIADHASPCVFVDSRRFEVATTRDGIHPTVAGSRVWVGGVLDSIKEAGWSWGPEAPAMPVTPP